LSQLLHLAGIDCIILERQTPEYVLGRIRAGLLERITVDMLHAAECGARLDREGLVHDGVALAFEGRRLRIDFKALLGAHVTVYGQTELTRDLMDKHGELGIHVVYSAENVIPSDFETAHPKVSYRANGRPETIDCDFIAGCDGFHGVSRASLPQG